MLPVAAWRWLLALLLWAEGVLHALAQGSGLPVAAENQEWRVVNFVPTQAVWALVELEFHITSSCDSQVRGAPISSGEVIASALGWHPALYAFDGRAEPSLARTWWPNCGVGDGSGGCAAEEAWVGQNFDLGAYDVRCIRVYQAPQANHRAAELALERWMGAEWRRVVVFKEALGDYFVNLPREPLAKWRLLPPEALSSGWAVAEVSFSSDVDCGGNLSGTLGSFGLVGNGSARSDLANDPRRVMDGDLATAWTAPCGGPCSARGPWLELILGQPGPVRCIRLLQSAASGAFSLELQAWTGERLVRASEFLGLRPGAWDHLARWGAADRLPGSLWRMVTNGTMPGEWAVAELELHGHASCSSKLTALAPTASGSLVGASTGALVDGDIHSYWNASAPSVLLRGAEWAGRYDRENATVHTLGFPWAGISSAPNARVLCVRLLQSGHPATSVPGFVLQRWSGEAWEDYRDVFAGYGEVSLWYTGLSSEHGLPLVPTWQNLPALDRSQYRVAQLDVLWMPWAIKELRFFETVDCFVEVSGLPLSAGENPAELPHPSRWAFDRELSTEWHSTCVECRAREAWVGLLLSTPRSVRCVRLFQSSRSPIWSQRLSFEKWNGHRWAIVAGFTSLSRGVWDHMHIYGHSRLADDAVSGLAYWSTPAGTLWRVANADILPLRWAVASLGFYTDLDCRLLITDGKPIASGHVIDFEAAAAFSGGPAAEWLSACEGCEVRQAWLGLRIPSTRRPRCVRLFQSARPRVNVRRAFIERWDGQVWIEEALLDGLEAGAWRSQPLLQLGAPEDRQVRWRVALHTMAASSFGPQTWRVGGIRFFGSGGCTDELHGYHIASGYADGHGAYLAFDDDPETYWESDCRACRDSEAWLGVSVRDDTRPVRCVQLRQPRSLPHGAGRVSVQGLAAGAGSWDVAASFEPMSFGAWDHLHLPSPLQLSPRQSAEEAAPAGSLWRLSAAAPVGRSWAVRRVGFFAALRSAACAQPLSGIAIASGQAEGYPPVNADFNSTAGAGWQAPCLECAAGTAWLGVWLPAVADVECVLLEQSELAPDYSPAVALERWDGSTWQPHRYFDGLGGGALQQLSAAWARPSPLQRFRVANAVDLTGGRWRVLELALSASLDCSLPVHGAAISSGFAGTASPTLALDGDTGTGWEASGFPPMAAGSRWLGVHFSGPQDVKCAVVLQGSGPGEWAPRLALEAWAGEAWQRVAELDALGVGAWLALNTFAAAWRPLFVNFQDRATIPPPGYEADIGRPFGSQLSGHTYGWSCVLRGANRGRLNDPLLDTLVELDGCLGPHWDLQLPVGRYYVRLTYSNPGLGGRSNGCRLEDQRAGVGVYGPKEHKVAEVAVDVPDGLLTFSAPAATGEACEAIAAISVVALPSLDTMWRVVNGARVRGSWHVQELEVRTQSTCEQTSAAQQRTGLLFSGYLQGKPPELAVDGDVATAWASACQGCPPGAAWLGLTFAALEPVRCLRLYQSLQTDSQTGIIVLERWNGTAWGAFQTFVDTPGGLWGEYNDRWVRPPSGQRWRLVAEAGTEGGPLRVAEAVLFEDVGCSRPVQGFAISNEFAPKSPVFNAFDSDLQTEWVSSCDPCLPSEAWLGLHAGSPVEVLCASLVLGGGGGGRQLLAYGVGADASTAEVPFRLESWNGTGWAATEAVLVGRPGARVSTQRLGQVQELELGMVWRLVNLANTSAPWRIQELQFYATSDCQGLLAGAPLASSESPELPARLAFDGDQAYASAWAAGCPSAGCAPETEWLGSLFTHSEAPLCVRVYQSSATLLGDPASRVVRLERWGDGRRWEIMRTFGSLQPLASGRWTSLTVVSAAEKYRTAAAEWRLVADTAPSRRWAVAEVAFFEEPECRNPLPGTPGASGEAGNRFVTSAFDGLPETAWWSQDAPGPREAWLGLAFGRQLIVRCVQLLQQPDAGYFAEEVQLQVRPEADWLHVLSFTHVASGQWQSLHVFQAVVDKPPGAMWRVANFDVVESGWALVELEFYVDEGCSRIEVGQPISSGHSTDEDPSNAFDLRLGSWWRSPCRRCSSRKAWLGQSFHRLDAAPGESSARSAEVRCVVLLQDTGTNKSRADTVVLERWDGTVFRRVGKFSGVISGEFVQLRPGGSYKVNDTVTVDWPRRQQLLAASAGIVDPPGLRDRLHRERDRVQAFAVMSVTAWPPELSASLQYLEDFRASFAAALRTAASARLQQPRQHVFADNVVMTEASTPTQRASITSTLVAYVATAEDEVTGAIPWETNAQAVLEKAEGISDDPYNRESLFLTDRLKVELRKENRFSPLRAQVVAAIESSIDLRLTNVLFIPASIAPPPAPPPPTPPPPPPPPADRTLLFVLLVIGVIVLGASFGAWRYRRMVNRRLQLDMEVWDANNPGIPFPRPEGGQWRLCCGRCCRCCSRRTPWDNSAATGLSKSKQLALPASGGAQLALQKSATARRI